MVRQRTVPFEYDPPAHRGASRRGGGGMSEDPERDLNDALSDHRLSRRGLMKLAGAATAASASLGGAASAFAQERSAIEEKAAAEAGLYEAQAGRAKDTNAKAAALTWLDNNAGKVTALNDEVFA